MWDGLVQKPDSTNPDGAWIWADADSGVIRSQFTLFLPDGRVGGSDHWLAWRPTAHGLVLTDHEGSESTLAQDGAGFTGDGHRLIPAGPWPIHALPPLRQGRRNLVVLRSGDASLHPLWLETMRDQPRNWDLCLSYYGDHPARWHDQAEHFIAQKGTKFGGLAPLVGQDGFLWDYEYIWFPDDDLLIDGADINQMFALARRFDLLLAQPSLAPGCFVNHRITEQQADYRLRFTSFVEIMAPLFARQALAVAAPSFGLNQTGYGLDHLWPALLGTPQGKVAVLDEIAMVHTRPMGANYDVEGASTEGWDLLDRFGLRQLYAVYGAVSRHPRGWSRVRGDVGRAIVAAEFVEG